MKDEICDECGRECDKVWLSKFAKEPNPYWVCGYCRVGEEQDE